jgi:hypothetical protein
MKPYSFAEFNKRFNMFGWLHPDIRQTYWTKEDSNWDYEQQRSVRKTFTLSTIWYNNQRVIQFYTNDENNGSKKLTAYNINRENARAVGLTTHQSYRCNASTIMDALYYRVNPPTYYNKNGTLKKGFWGALVRRLRSNALRSSWVTQHMLHEGIRIAQAYYPGSSYDNIEAYLESKNVPSWSYYQDFLTREYHIDGEQRRVRLGTHGWVQVHKSTDPRSHGYNYHERNDIFLKPNHFYHDGNVYNRDEVDIVECSQCGNESVSELCIDGVCHNCLDSSYKIHNYSTRVESMLKFKATKVRPNTVYLGCELEYETNNRNRAQLGVGKLMHGHALMKSDGSIKNGFEIVTCPATLDIHLQVFKSFFDNLPTDLKVEKNVGMHVHISRKPLSQLTLGKMTEFLNRAENKLFIAHIAGRIDNNYARMDSGRTVTFPWKHRNGGDRYNALNLNNNNTVEVRLFATPINYKEFASRLQFVQALVDYCSPAQSSESLKKQTHYEAFMHWLSQRRRMFPELSYHLKEFV